MPLSIHSWTLGPFATNCYLAWDEASNDAIIFDASFGSEIMVREIQQLGANVKALINTHGHIDHVAGNRAVLNAFDVPLYIHELDIPLLSNVENQAQFFGVQAENSPPATGTIAEGDVIEIGEYRLEAIFTPGHCPGSLSFYDPISKICIVGDTLFAGSVGRTDLPGGDWDTLEASIINKLYTLPDETIIYPGHMGTSNIGYEKKTNPFVRG